jgi:hypothetical protein
MNIKLTTSNYITPNCVPRLYMGDALSTLNLGGLSREGIAAFFLVKKIYLVKKIIYDPACDGSFIEERAFPRFEFSLPELVNHLTNTPTFKPALSSSLLRAETSLEFAQSLQQVLAQVDTSKAKLIYFKGGPRSMPVLIGLMCDAALVLDSEILAHYIRCTPTYLFNKNFGSIYEAIKHDSDTPTTFDTSLTIGADPELALFESENILERDEEEISS